jgi:hypothetical protein
MGWLSISISLLAILVIFGVVVIMPILYIIERIWK